MTQMTKESTLKAITTKMDRPNLITIKQQKLSKLRSI